MPNFCELEEFLWNIRALLLKWNIGAQDRQKLSLMMRPLKAHIMNQFTLISGGIECKTAPLIISGRPPVNKKWTSNMGPLRTDLNIKLEIGQSWVHKKLSRGHNRSINEESIGAVSVEQAYRGGREIRIITDAWKAPIDEFWILSISHA